MKVLIEIFSMKWIKGCQLKIHKNISFVKSSRDISKLIKFKVWNTLIWLSTKLRTMWEVWIKGRTNWWMFFLHCPSFSTLAIKSQIYLKINKTTFRNSFSIINGYYGWLSRFCGVYHCQRMQGSNKHKMHAYRFYNLVKKWKRMDFSILKMDGFSSVLVYFPNLFIFWNLQEKTGDNHKISKGSFLEKFFRTFFSEKSFGTNQKFIFSSEKILNKQWKK